MLSDKPTEAKKSTAAKYQQGRTSQRLVKFSHSMVVGGSAPQTDIVDLSHDFNEFEDDAVVSVSNVRLPAGSPAVSPSNSATHAGKKVRKFSIDTQNDPIGYGMSSFLSTRDSHETQNKKERLDSEELLRNYLSKLITEINAGKLDELGMRQLKNFAQKLINAHSAGEVIGRHFTSSHADPATLEVLVDATPSPELAGAYAAGSTLKSVNDVVSKVMADIRCNRLTAVQLADLALVVATATSKSALELKTRLNSAVRDDPNKKMSDGVLHTLQQRLKLLQQAGRDHSISAISGKGNDSSGQSPSPPSTLTVKWHEVPESQYLIRIVHKLKTQIILAPNGGSFVESLEKVLKDVDEDISKGFLNDAMIITLCAAITYQEWQNEECLDKARSKENLTKFDVLANEVILKMFTKTTTGMEKHEYTMEDLIRLTTLSASCGIASLQSDASGVIASDQPEPSCKEQEEIILQALGLMKRLLDKDKVSIYELKTLAVAAYKLQSKTAGTAMHTQNIWTFRKFSSRCANSRPGSIRSSIHSEKPEKDDVEISFLTHLRMKLNNLRDVYSSIELLHTTFRLTECSLDALSTNSSLTDFWAAGLVLVVAIIFDRIKSDCYTSAIDHKVLNLLVNNLVYEAFNVSLRTLQRNDISIESFQLLTTSITKYRINETDVQSFGISPRLLTGTKNQAAQDVSSPYAVMNFLEKSLQIMKNSAISKPLDVKALGEYALSLQHYYGQEVVNDKSSGKIIMAEAPKMSPWQWSGSNNDHRPLITIAVTPSLILEHLDKAIEKVRQQEVDSVDVMSIAGFVTYLVEIPEKLACDQPTELPPNQTYSLKEFEERILQVQKITHHIPRFDFILKNLEKTLADLQNDKSEAYAYDLILLCMCIFVAYEWIRTEPLNIFSVTKLDDRAADVIYEAMRCTLREIEFGTLALNDLQNLTKIITNTTDLRRASTLNISTSSRGNDSSPSRSGFSFPNPSQPVGENDTEVLALIDEIIVSETDISHEVDPQKINKILTSMTEGLVSSHLHELLVLAICVAASHKGTALSNLTETTRERLDSMPEPDVEMQQFAMRSIKRTVDGLRRGYMPEGEVTNFIDYVLQETDESIVSPRQLRDAVSYLSDKGGDLNDLLDQLNSNPPYKCARLASTVVRVHEFNASIDDEGTAFT